MLAFLQAYRQRNGYAPTMREIAGACGVKSLSAVQFHLDRLERDGAIRRDREKSRGIALPPQEGEGEAIPVLGAIAAGRPVSVPDADTWRTAREWVDAPLAITRGKKEVYALRVRGNSMVDALIGDGDIVIMQAGAEVRSGDVAACWLKEQQEVTLKKIDFDMTASASSPATPT